MSISLGQGQTTLTTSLIVRDRLTARLGDLTNPLAISSGWSSEGLSRRAMYPSRLNLDWFKRSFLAIFVDYKEDSIWQTYRSKPTTVRDLAGRLNVEEKTVYRLAQRVELRWIDLQERAGAGQAVEGDKA